MVVLRFALFLCILLIDKTRNNNNKKCQPRAAKVRATTAPFLAYGPGEMATPTKARQSNNNEKECPIWKNLVKRQAEGWGDRCIGGSKTHLLSPFIPSPGAFFSFSLPFFLSFSVTTQIDYGTEKKDGLALAHKQLSGRGSSTALFNAYIFRHCLCTFYSLSPLSLCPALFSLSRPLSLSLSLSVSLSRRLSILFSTFTVSFAILPKFPLFLPTLSSSSFLFLLFVFPFFSNVGQRQQMN